mmetsp:Transcript_3678/g.11398  ORF Transcript_3678/g.11398 Transcript_3678/m.11398 type:complete len:235 (+) Transcript_3678:212-916(+)
MQQASRPIAGSASVAWSAFDTISHVTSERELSGSSGVTSHARIQLSFTLTYLLCASVHTYVQGMHATPTYVRTYARKYESTNELCERHLARAAWQSEQAVTRPANCANPWRPSPDAPCEQAGRSLVRRQLSAVCLAIASGSACSPSLGTRSSIAATPQIATMPFFWCTVTGRSHGPLRLLLWAPRSFLRSFLLFAGSFGHVSLAQPHSRCRRRRRSGRGGRAGSQPCRGAARAG